MALDVRRMPGNRTIEIDTPHAAVTIERPGYYRLDVEDERTAVATSRGGTASIIPAGGEATDVGSDERVVIEGTDYARVTRDRGSGADEWTIQLVPLGNGRAVVREESRGLRSRPFELGDDDVFDVMLANNGFVNVLRGDHELWAKPYDGPTEGFAAGDDVRSLPVPTSLCQRVLRSVS